MQPAATPLIEMADVGFSYPDGTPAVDGVSLRIDAGEYVALVGRNGCGKSTLCRLMNGLLLPTTGAVTVAGIDTRDAAGLMAVRAAVAMVFQVPDNQIVATMVDQDVAFGPENLGVPQPELERRVRRALETVGMWQQRRRPPHLLSEGERQRVAIAGALAMEPRCLVLDEATSMLDPAARARVLEVAEQVNGDGVTLIMVTHDMAEARRAGRLVAMDRGRVAYDGPVADALGDPELLEGLGLVAPPAARLSQAIHRRRPAFPGTLLSPDEVSAALLRLLEGAVERR